MSNDWPKLEYLSWRDTCSALHLYTQIAGKYRLAHTPWLNHSWHATFYVTPRGLRSSLIPDGSGIEIEFDFQDHEVRGTSGDGRGTSFALGPSTVAAFHASFVRLVSDLGGRPTFDGQPNEVPFPMPFREDHRDRPYDRDAVRQSHRALLAIDGVFKAFRSSFLGKSSPVHLFWGSFDMAVTRFSGRRAPLHPGGVPALPDHVAHEAYDREVASAGFWPGGGGIDYPAFYAYAYPAAKGYGLRRSDPRPRSGTRAYRSSSCPTMPCSRRPTPTQISWHFSFRPTRRLPISADGTAIFWNVRKGGRAKYALRIHKCRRMRLRRLTPRSSGKTAHRKGATGLWSTALKPK